jgi:hypothetical protein
LEINKSAQVLQVHQLSLQDDSHPQRGKSVKILGESKVLLSFMKPNSTESLTVFDMIWQQIIHASCFPLKGCLHAPFIMKMIEVVTQFRYEKGTRHLSYTPF